MIKALIYLTIMSTIYLLLFVLNHHMREPVENDNCQSCDVLGCINRGDHHA